MAGFWDTLQSFVPETERTKMYKSENALRLKALEREERAAAMAEENLLRQKSAQSAFMNRTAPTRTIENSIFDSGQPTDQLLAKAQPQEEFARRAAAINPPQFTGTIGQDQDAYIQGRKVASGPRSPVKTASPESPLGKLALDLREGRISQAEYDAAVRKETYIAPDASSRPWRMLTDAEAAEAGLPSGGSYKTNGVDFEVVVQPKQDKPSEGESKYAFNAERLAASGAIMEDVLEKDPSAISSFFSADTYAGRKAMKPQQQRFQGAIGNAIDAAITMGTGASYTPDQIAAARASMMPAPGDSDEVLEDKFAMYNAYANAAKRAAREAGKDITIPDLKAAYLKSKGKGRGATGAWGSDVESLVNKYAPRK